MDEPKISLIAAISDNNVIGRDNKLPWHISTDLQRFKKLTLNHPIIMGRKTFGSIGKPLPKRTNIIITRDKDYKVEGAIVVHSIKEAIETAQKSEHGKEEIFIIGGGQIFKEAIAFADKLYLTIVHVTIDGDAYFPDYSAFKKVTFQENGEGDGYYYSFVDLEAESCYNCRCHDRS